MKSLKIGLCAAVFLFAIPVSPNATMQYNDSTEEKYVQVLDLVFPTDWCDRFVQGARITAIDAQESRGNGTPKKKHLEGVLLPDIFSQEQITVRVLPSFWQESQIVVCRWPDGKTFLVHSTLAASDRMVWSPVIEESMGRRKPRSVEAIAAAFHPVHRVCDADPAAIGDWFKQLHSLPFDVPAGGGTDGITYEITLKAGMNVIHARVWGPDEKASLISWVEKVQQARAKLSCKETTYRHP